MASTLQHVQVIPRSDPSASRGGICAAGAGMRCRSPTRDIRWPCLLVANRAQPCESTSANTALADTYRDADPSSLVGWEVGTWRTNDSDRCGEEHHASAARCARPGGSTQDSQQCWADPTSHRRIPGCHPGRLLFEDCSEQRPPRHVRAVDVLADDGRARLVEEAPSKRCGRLTLSTQVSAEGLLSIPSSAGSLPQADQA